jgi:hypothetical protein
MKIFSLILMLAVTVTSFSQNIGLTRNGVYRITANMDPVKAKWEKMLEVNGIDAVLTKFEIKAVADRGNGETFYMLIGSNTAKTVRVGRSLRVTGGNFSYLSNDENDVLICTGCFTCMPSPKFGKLDCGDTTCEDGTDCNMISNR